MMDGVRPSRGWGGVGIGCGCLLALMVPALMIAAFYADPASRKLKPAPLEASVARPALSPSGGYWLMVLEGAGPDGARIRQWQVLSTSTGTPTLIFTCPDWVSARGKPCFAWDAEDRVWVYSQDTGTSYWEHKSQSEWVRPLEPQSGPIPPEIIRQRQEGKTSP